MAIVVYPLDAISGAPSYTGRMLRETVAPLLAGATAARPLGIRSGVRPGTSVTTVTLASFTYSIAELAGAMDVQAAAEAGPYLFANNAVATGTLNAADASNPRADMLCIQVSDNAEDGSAAATGQFVYAAGAPAAIPALPAQPARSIILATFAVPKVGAGSPTVTWVAPYLSAAGAPALALTKAILDTITGSRLNELGVVFNDTTSSKNGEYRWNGSAWLPAMPYVILGMSAAQSVVGSGSNTPVNWDSEVADTPGWHDNVTNPSRITPTVAGLYRYTYKLAHRSTTATQFLAAAVSKNGTNVVQSLNTVSGNTNGFVYITATGLVTLNGSTDYVQIAASSSVPQALEVASSLFELQYVGVA